MYHRIIRHVVTNLFVELNRGNYEPILASFAPQFEHCFVGQHALSGRRTSMPVTRAWYERLARVFPNLRFELRAMTVAGWPWDTTVTVEWDDSYTLLNGERRDNTGVHVIRLKWGRGVSVRIHCDTARLLENLAIQRAGGVEDAAFPPLVG